MESILYFSENGQVSDRLTPLKALYQIETVDSIRKVALFLLDHPDLPFMLYSAETHSEASQSVIEIISKINSVLPVLVLGLERMKQFHFFTETYRNVILIKEEESLPEVAKKITRNRRRFNRVNWPLSAIFYQAENTDKIEHGLVESISAQGAFIRTTDFDLLKKGNIFIEMSFGDFRFLVEGRIVRKQQDLLSREPLGFAVEFINVSAATQACIKRLVDDRLLSLFIRENEDEKNPKEAKAGQIIKF